MAEPKVSIEIDDKAIQNVLKRFKKLPDDVKKDVGNVIDKGAKSVKKDARREVEDASDIVFRYKKQGSKKAAKGKGNVVAYYHPGNLRKSIKVLDRRLKNAKEPSAYVGPQFRKGKRNTGGEFGVGRFDPYYFLMYTIGSHKGNWAGNDVLGKATRANQAQITQAMKRAVSKVIEKANK